MTQEQPPKPSALEYLKAKLNIAMMFSPPIHPCKSCGWPKADGYVCNCGAQE